MSLRNSSFNFINRAISQNGGILVLGWSFVDEGYGLLVDGRISFNLSW